MSRPMTLSPQEQQVLRDMIAFAQVEEVISLLEELSATRKARYVEGTVPTVDEVLNDPERRRLTDYLYALDTNVRNGLVVLMLLGRGDFDHAYERAIETCSKLTSADDQVMYLMGKTFRLAHYLRRGLERLESSSDEK